jgi:hypothetical protein
MNAFGDDGLVECWNTGYNRRKKIYFTKKAVAAFNGFARCASILFFRLEKMTGLQ